uniref:Uncharacterized protein n=1 Tax=Tanacetum cinerariifolium TaxID=118510 RepID=A0A699GQJ4_TANCI|nr:hypothetical protein [Tanacetum cinerariifolium]
MMDVFESMKSDLDTTWKRNEILNDQLLEATLKHDVEKCVLMCNDFVNVTSLDKIKKVKRESIDVQKNLHKRIKILEYDVQRGCDLLTGVRESNLYTISISDTAASSPICLMGKSKKAHPPKMVPTHSKLELIHMDLCVPMMVESIYKTL